MAFIVLRAFNAGWPWCPNRIVENCGLIINNALGCFVLLCSVYSIGDLDFDLQKWYSILTNQLLEQRKKYWESQNKWWDRRQGPKKNKKAGAREQDNCLRKKEEDPNAKCYRGVFSNLGHFQVPGLQLSELSFTSHAGCGIRGLEVYTPGNGQDWETQL